MFDCASTLPERIFSSALTISYLQMTPKSNYVLLGKSDNLSDLQIPQVYHEDGLNDFLVTPESDSVTYRDVKF